MIRHPYKPFIGIFAGDPGVGKSYGCLSFPDPILVIDLENRADWNLMYWSFKEIEIRSALALSDTNVKIGDRKIMAGMPHPLKTINKLEYEISKAVKEMREGKWATVVVDSISDIRDWAAVEAEARGIKLWTPQVGPVGWRYPNERTRELLFPLIHASRQLAREGVYVNVVFTAWLKDEYDDAGRRVGKTIDTKDFVLYNVDWIIWFIKKEETVRETVEENGKKKVVAVTRTKYYARCDIPGKTKGFFSGWVIDITDVGFWKPFIELMDKKLEELKAKIEKIKQAYRG